MSTYSPYDLNNLLMFLFQLKKEPANEEATQQLQLLAPIHSDILSAKDFHRNKQFDAAIDLLGRVVDVRM